MPPALALSRCPASLGFASVHVRFYSARARRQNEGTNAMKRIVLIAAISLLACGSASAARKRDAAAKKPAGAALTSFMKKCESDAKKKCEADSTAQNLKGAAASSHTK